MNAAISFEQWTMKGTFSPFVQERRLVASTQAWMVNICQPAGDFPDPPLQEMVVIQDLSRARAVCDLGAGRFKCEPGSITVVPCLSATQITVENAHNIRLLGFSPQKLGSWVGMGDGATDLGRLHASSLQSTFTHQLLDRIWGAGSNDGSSTSLYADAALLTLWSELLREAQKPAPIFRGGLAPWQARLCIEFLNAHVSENVGLEQLAGLVKLSPFHFARAFKQSIGVPPHRYQLRLRIDLAKTMLAKTDAPVTKIAFDVGYESSQALARLFRCEVGLSPSDYRRQHRS